MQFGSSGDAKYHTSGMTCERWQIGIDRQTARPATDSEPDGYPGDPIYLYRVHTERGVITCEQPEFDRTFTLVELEE